MAAASLPMNENARLDAREISFRTHALLEPDRATVVPDARDDPRFRDNPYVVRGWAAARQLGCDTGQGPLFADRLPDALMALTGGHDGH